MRSVVIRYSCPMTSPRRTIWIRRPAPSELNSKSAYWEEKGRPGGRTWTLKTPITPGPRTSPSWRTPPVSTSARILRSNGGERITRLIRFADTGPGPWTVDVDYGDGTITHHTISGPEQSVHVNYVYANSGDYTISVTVEDAAGYTSSDAIEVEVTNAAPKFTSTPIRSAEVGVLYEYTATAEDTDQGDRGDGLKFRLQSVSLGADLLDCEDEGFFCTKDGRVTWTPSYKYYGQTVDVVLEVRDSNYPPGIGTQTYTISVNAVPGNNDPYFVNEADKEHIVPVSFSPSSDDVDPVILNLGLAEGQTWQTVLEKVDDDDVDGVKIEIGDKPRYADVVFIVDTSGSMQDAIDWLSDEPLDDEAVVSKIDAELQERGFRQRLDPLDPDSEWVSTVNYAVVEYAQMPPAFARIVSDANGNGVLDEYDSRWGNADEARDILLDVEAELMGSEDGYYAMEWILRNDAGLESSPPHISFREEAQVCFVLVTDFCRIEYQGIEEPGYASLDYEGVLRGKEAVQGGE